MNKSIYKSAFVFILMIGILLTSVAPSVLAQGQSRTRIRSMRYVDDYHRDSDYQRDRVRRDRDYDYENDPYYDRNRSKKEGLKRTGIGAAIGAAGGGIMGGRKGALIGGIVGAAGGYIYHKQKENNRRY